VGRVLTGDHGGTRLPRAFFARRSAVVARALIGKLMVHRSAAGPAGGVVVEVEAYDQSDPASHSFAGETARNRVMFGEAGHAYVYFSYGMHWCVNVVTGKIGHGAAVLIRALEPTLGVELMKRRRRIDAERDLARGPGRLTQALGIDRSLDGSDLIAGPIGFYDLGTPRPRVAVTPRIGISRAADVPWRFVAAGSRFASGRVGVTARRRG
jgi:DNA-3-methyladenine glycosylase